MKKFLVRDLGSFWWRLRHQIGYLRKTTYQ